MENKERLKDQAFYVEVGKRVSFARVMNTAMLAGRNGMKDKTLRSVSGHFGKTRDDGKCLSCDFKAVAHQFLTFCGLRAIFLEAVEVLDRVLSTAWWLQGEEGNVHRRLKHAMVAELAIDLSLPPPEALKVCKATCTDRRNFVTSSFRNHEPTSIVSLVAVETLVNLISLDKGKRNFAKASWKNKLQLA